MTELCESLVARSTFLVVSLVKGIKKFGLLLGCESHSDLIIPSEDGHDRSLWQRVPLRQPCRQLWFQKRFAC